MAAFRHLPPVAASAAAVLAIALAVILAALGFQFIGGYAPCHLCYIERYAYYFAVPAAFVAAFAGQSRPNFARLLLLLIALAFLGNTVLSIYHTGVEWKLWEGPSSCTGGGGATDWESLAEQLKTTSMVRCDEPALKVFGLSLAAWNVAASAVLALLAAFGALRGKRG